MTQSKPTTSAIRPISRQRQWQMRKIQEGNCVRCGRPRITVNRLGRVVATGTSAHCRKCADECVNVYANGYRNRKRVEKAKEKAE